MTTTRTITADRRRPALRRGAAASLVAILVGCLSGGHAATVDIDYGQLRDLPFGKSLLGELKIDIPGAECDYAATLDRLRLDWDGTKSPLLIAARGLPVAAMKLALADATPMATPLGQALPLPRDKRYALLPVADDEVVMGTARGLGDFKQQMPWPEPSGAAITFTGVPKDINLAEFADRIDDFTITMSRDGMLVAKLNAKDRKAARGLMSYISNRLPLLNAAAAVGVEKAQFPKRMIDAAVIERVGGVITITVDLTKDPALHKEANEFLLHTLRGRMKKAS